jgi:hypothetical protein
VDFDYRSLPTVPPGFPILPIPMSYRFSVDLNLISTHAEEITMKVITIGKRLVPAEQVAFVEPFDPSSNPEFKPEKDFKGRVVLLNREVVLTGQTPQEFAAEHDVTRLSVFPGGTAPGIDVRKLRHGFLLADDELFYDVPLFSEA